MKRRDFSLALLASTGTAAGLLAGCKPQSSSAPAASGAASASASAGASAASPASAAGFAPVKVVDASTFVAGTDYLPLKAPVASDAPKGKAEVIEFFGYWCPHCNHFEPEFDAWRKSAPAQIVVTRVPMAFRPEAAPLQRLYFALLGLNKVDAMHSKVFDAIHKEKLQLYTDEAVLAWAAKQPEIAGDGFVKAYKSFGMESQIKRASQMMVDYGVEGVPSLGVAGKYYVDGEHAKSLTRALEIATALAVQEARKG